MQVQIIYIAPQLESEAEDPIWITEEIEKVDDRLDATMMNTSRMLILPDARILHVHDLATVVLVAAASGLLCSRVACWESW
ncbi:hypothetical protein KSF_033980 [Reticulibacter mediterranei]|uniref:Uncharacterized protein n=1 Tax=Reticulibacter mediterranei TaxID=2778369 RepID=A0A8J3IJ11_9CHLR|nr:hypothetical protein KSF_033980 [Reticulibacter mediterranei]